MDLMRKKLQEEEDKKNVKEGGKSSCSSNSNSNSNKSKSVNAVAKGNNKASAGKPAGKPQ